MMTLTHGEDFESLPVSFLPTPIYSRRRNPRAIFCLMLAVLMQARARCFEASAGRPELNSRERTEEEPERWDGLS